MAVENLAGGDHDADLCVGFRPWICRPSFGRTAERYWLMPTELNEWRVGILADDALQLVGELAAALQRGDQSALHRKLRRIAVDRGQCRRGVRSTYSFKRGSGLSERARVTSWL